MFQTYVVSNNSSSLHSILPNEFALENQVSHTRFSQSKNESSRLNLLEMKFVSNLT